MATTQAVCAACSRKVCLRSPSPSVSGLDPTGRDPILLTLGDGDRKQTLREQAAQTACLVAIAGDERRDFDELFGYLRDPTMATNFDSLLGAGWFLVPNPLAAPGD